MRRGDAGSPIIMWIGAVAAGAIVLVWYLQHLSPGQVTIQRMDYDLERIHEQVNLACESESSSSSIPIKSKGTLIVNSSSMCISAVILDGNETRCLPVPCAVQPATLSIDFGRVGVRKASGVVSVNP